MIELLHLQKKYENATPLEDVNAVINDGDVISIIGPSGAGKSTLIRCINMLERPTSGKILLDGVDITAPK
ncbi:MAG: amino acid ABC transporter ATP-binding protein, partial [Clostridia bacterium]|nr:amino acid ABC transporter ATP-binding protein [Clostridia bacterium]